VALAQGMAAAHTPQRILASAALGACRRSPEVSRALRVGARTRRLRVLVNVGIGLRRGGVPGRGAYPVHQFPEITEFLHERWAGGGEPNAWVETADGPAEGRAGYCHQRVGCAASARAWMLCGRTDRPARARLG